MIVQVMMIIMIKMTDNGIGDRSNGSAKSSFAQQCHFSSTLRGARRPSPPTAPCPEWTAQATSASCARRTWWQQPSSGGPPARTSPAASSTDRSPAGFTAHPLALPCVEVHQLPLLGILGCCSILPLISCSLFWLIWKKWAGSWPQWSLLYGNEHGFELLTFSQTWISNHCLCY